MPDLMRKALALSRTLRSPSCPSSCSECSHRRGARPRQGRSVHLPHQRTRHGDRLLPRRGSANLHDVPAHQEHRDHRIRLRGTRKASTAPRPIAASTSTSSPSTGPTRRRCAKRATAAEASESAQALATWLDSLAKLHPAPNESEIGYKERVVRPYDEFSEQTKNIRALMDAPPPVAAKLRHRRTKPPKAERRTAMSGSGNRTEARASRMLGSRNKAPS